MGLASQNHMFSDFLVEEERLFNCRVGTVFGRRIRAGCLAAGQQKEATGMLW